MLGLYSKDKKPLCSLFCGNKSNIINIEVCIRHQTLCRNKSNIINLDLFPQKRLHNV
jgi:hypothetical protein